ncbi:hypothetical protein QZH41_000370 [Actinostola sp. cb2023]|nr:hypothetical protein QZH41_000370 [Actinostola sp. cb2023]
MIGAVLLCQVSADSLLDEILAHYQENDPLPEYKGEGSKAQASSFFQVSPPKCLAGQSIGDRFDSRVRGDQTPA